MNPDIRELLRLIAGAMGALLWVAVIFVGVIAVYGGRG